MTGKTWTSKLGGKDREGPEIDNLDIKVSTKWKDEVLAEKYPDGWFCLPESIGANDEFNCKHPPVNITEFKNTKTWICGAPLKRIDPSEVGILTCGVETTATYTYSTEGFRMFKFSDDPDLVDWGELEQDDVWWSADAPVILTIDQRPWNKAIEPWDSYVKPSNPIDFLITTYVSNNIPTDIADVIKGLSIDDISTKLGKLTLEIPSRVGIHVDCNGGEKRQEDRFSKSYRGVKYNRRQALRRKNGFSRGQNRWYKIKRSLRGSCRLDFIYCT